MEHLSQLENTNPDFQLPESLYRMESPARTKRQTSTGSTGSTANSELSGAGDHDADNKENIENFGQKRKHSNQMRPNSRSFSTMSSIAHRIKRYSLNLNHDNKISSSAPEPLNGLPKSQKSKLLNRLYGSASEIAANYLSEWMGSKTLVEHSTTQEFKSQTDIVKDIDLLGISTELKVDLERKGSPQQSSDENSNHTRKDFNEGTQYDDTPSYPPVFGIDDLHVLEGADESMQTVLSGFSSAIEEEVEEGEEGLVTVAAGEM